MPENTETPIANNHPVPLSDRDTGSTGPYPNVPEDDQVISTEDLGPGDTTPLGYVGTGR